MQEQERKLAAAISPPLQQPASVADAGFYITYGVVISARWGDVEKIRRAIEAEGGKIAFQTVSNGDLYLLRRYQVERALDGDCSQLRDVYQRKQDRRLKT